MPEIRPRGSRAHGHGPKPAIPDIPFRIRIAAYRRHIEHFDTRLERERKMRSKTGMTLLAVALLLSYARPASAIDTAGMELRSDLLFRRHDMRTQTRCTEEQAVITLYDNPDGKRPPPDKVIDALALVGKSFNQEFGASYFYKMAVFYDGRKWIETLAGNCRDSFQDNIVSHCYYKINF